MEQRHTFLGHHARTYGLKESIVLHTIIYFVLLNEKNNRNKREGKYWTFNSAKNWMPYFPFFTERQISYTLTSLIKQGALIESNFNKRRYDKSKWFTLTPRLYGQVKNSPYWKERLTKMVKPSDKNVRPIPDINITTITPYI
jgi:hypothetical protein